MKYAEDHMLESLKNHILEEVLPETNGFQAFMMKRPGEGRMMSTLIVFTPEGIVICGDLCPRPGNNRGIKSDLGYGLGWFIGKLSEPYLCEKFLWPEWQPEVAEEWCKGAAKDLEQEIKEGEGGDEDLKKDRVKKLKGVRQLGEKVGGWVRGQAMEFYEEAGDLGFDLCDDVGGTDYPRGEAGWLCAIQQRFAELYQDWLTRRDSNPHSSG